MHIIIYCSLLLENILYIIYIHIYIYIIYYYITIVMPTLEESQVDVTLFNINARSLTIPGTEKRPSHEAAQCKLPPNPVGVLSQTVYAHDGKLERQMHPNIFQ